MTLRRTFVVSTLLVGCLISTCGADTIYFKSGISISADSVNESGETITYMLGSTRYSLPKSAVARVEHSSKSMGITVSTPTTGSAMPAAATPRIDASGTDSANAHRTNNPSVQRPQKEKLAAAAPAQAGEQDPTLARILNLGQIDEQALASIERAGNARESASAYLTASTFELNHGRIASARRYVDRAAHFEPEIAFVHVLYAVIATGEQNYADALSHAKRAVALAPDAAYAIALLGTAYYNADDMKSAVASWKRALAIRDSDMLRGLIAKAEKQMEVEGDYAEQASSHFVLHYEGREIGIALKADLLTSLEDSYLELQRELAFTPSADISVVLYSEKTFFDVTQAPSWAGAIYDGKLRIPIAGVNTVTPQMRHMLKHELAHSFIHAMTHGRCPAWLNEGIAMVLEPRSSAPFRAYLAPVFRDGKYAPLEVLEAPFSHLNAEQARLAYAESLIAVEYLRGRDGMRGLQGVLESLGSGMSAEEALRSVTHRGYRDIESELAGFASTPAGASGE